MSRRRYSYVSLLLQTCANVKSRRRRTQPTRELSGFVRKQNKVFIISVLELARRRFGINFVKRIRADFFLHATVSTRFPQLDACLESSQTLQERPI
jgi:hypothetical protein